MEGPAVGGVTGPKSQERSALLIDELACVNVRGRVMACAACLDACDGQALSLSLDGIGLDAARCAACGACVPNCPAGALRLPGFSPKGFLHSLGRQPAVQLHCSDSCDSGNAVRIPCHRLLDARLLAAAYAEGTVSFQLHGHDQCAHCPMGDATGQISLLQKTLQAWFGQQAPSVIFAPGNRDEEKEERQQRDRSIRSRRDFLRGAGLRATAGAAALLLPSVKAHDNEFGASPPYPADLDRGRPAAYQALLLEHAADLPWRQLPWTTRSIAAACTACLACGQRCPTGALGAWSGATTRGIDFDPGLCTSCGLCEQICPEQAIRVGDATSLSEVLSGRAPLVTRPVGSCSACQRAYVPGADASELCPACEKERALKKEWLGLLGR
ncbi:MAG TPA: 4Fe-4S dicluster domain-containing protein [Rhodocyclaceae bacterium]|nr:4Fe-4S dicluster domain-containing protein [Rhodocyclaceae bacterium]